MGRVGGAGPTKPTYARNEAIHRVRPEISRIESRYRWKGGAGQWYQGVVTGGFAYTASTAEIPPGVYTPPNPGVSEDKNPVKEEIRAFDSLGNPVPVKN